MAADSMLETTTLEDLYGESDMVRTHDAEQSIIKPSAVKMVGTVTPFLARHIPDQYTPLGVQDPPQTQQEHDSNTNVSYRHRLDLLSRRQADEPTMEHLQKELESLSQADQQTIAHVWSVFSAAPNKHRDLILRGILQQCSFPQLSSVASSVRELLRIDFLSALPQEVALRILCFLDTTSLCKAAQVSRRWQILADDDELWHRMCKQHIDRKCTTCGWGLPLLERERLFGSRRQTQLHALGRKTSGWCPEMDEFLQQPENPPDADRVDAATVAAAATTDDAPAAGSSNVNGNGKRDGMEGDEGHDPRLVKRSRTDAEPSTRRPWKEVYRDRFKIGSNWKHGRCSIKIFRGHTDGVMCLQFNDKILATGSYDATVKIWEIESGQELRTLHGHLLGIRALQFDEQRLISGSMDHSIKVWDWGTGKCQSTLFGHRNTVVCVHFESNTLATGSADHDIRIWNLDGQTSYVLKGHKEWVNDVKLQLRCQTLLSASDDCTVRLWDLTTRTCLRVFDEHAAQVQQVVPLPLEFEYEEEPAIGTDAHRGPGSPSHEVRSFRAESVATLASGASDRSDRQPACVRYMVTGSLDATIRLWDVMTGQCLRTFFGHIEGVWALAADTVRIVSGANDRTVKVWDARTGRCERTFTGHTGPVNCIGLSDTRLCSGSEDCDVRMMSFCGDISPSPNSDSVLTTPAAEADSDQTSESLGPT